MVGKPRPAEAPQHLSRLHGKAADIDAVHAQARHQRREGAGAVQHLVHAQPLHQEAAQGILPVVEVPGDQQRGAGWHLGADPVDERTGLTGPAAGEQPEVDDEAMHRALAHLQHAVQDATPLEHVVGEVAVLDGQDGKLRQQRVAVMPVQVAGIEAIDGLETAGGLGVQRQVLGLRIGRPLREALGKAIVLTLHFLQEHHVGLQLMQALTHFLHHGTTAQRGPGHHALVDVVGGHPQPQ